MNALRLSLLVALLLSASACRESTPPTQARLLVRGQLEAPTDAPTDWTLLPSRHGRVVRGFSLTRDGDAFTLLVPGEAPVDLQLTILPERIATGSDAIIHTLGPYDAYATGVSAGEEIRVHAHRLSRAFVSMRVLDSEGRPVQRAHVHLKFLADWAQGTTSAGGEFVLESLPARPWRVRVRSEDGRAYGRALWTPRTAPLEVVLEPARRVTASAPAGGVDDVLIITSTDNPADSIHTQAWVPDGGGRMAVWLDPAWRSVGLRLVRMHASDRTSGHTVSTATAILPVEVIELE